MYLTNMEWYVRGDVVEAYDESGTVVLRRQREESDVDVPPYEKYLRAKLIGIVLSNRYSADIAGVDTSIGKIATDRGSQAMVSGALGFLGLMTDDVTYPWKLYDGTFFDLSGETLREIAAAVGNHVKKCFEQERRVVGLLMDATTEDELLAIDITLAPRSN